MALPQLEMLDFCSNVNKFEIISVKMAILAVIALLDSDALFIA
jgi:hypothetical protein